MKKKATIITVHNSENCGSFLQAYAMQFILQKNGFDTAFLYRSTKGTSHDGFACLKSIINFLIHFNIRAAIDRLNQWRCYESVQKKYFKEIREDEEYAKSTDIFILGSDTIWNFEEPYFFATAKRLLGIPFKGKRIITYAASVGNTSKTRFEEVVADNGGLSHIQKFLVRDTHTKEVLNDSVNIEAEIVCDPTLLMRAEDYDSLRIGKTINDPYLLIYFFGKIPDDVVHTIKDFAFENKLKIVSLMSRRDWCDIFVPSSPSNMISWYDNASVVVTNTFHGCAFSLLFQKPFAVYDEGKNKVKELLETYNEDYRLFKESYEMPKLLNKSCICMNVINDKAKESIEMLRSCLLQ